VDAEPIEEPAELAGRLEAAGLGCADFAETPPAERNNEVDLSGTCTLSNGRSATIDVLTTEERWDDYLAFFEVNCAFFPGEVISHVTGMWWSASVDANEAHELDPETTKQMAKALGGRYVTLKC
jgi:hypothetical protein